MKYTTNKGEIYNYWTVLEDEYYYIKSSKHRHAKCQCKCGKIALERIDHLINGKHKSCNDCSNLWKRKNTKTVGEISRAYYYDLIGNAKLRNLEFNVSHEFLWDLFLKQDGKCAISGIPLKLTSNIINNKPDRKNITASLDRKNPYLPYTEDNVQWVHKWINIMKGALSDGDFISVCKVVANFNKDKEDNFEPSSMNGYMQRRSVYRSREGATTSD